MSEALEAYLPSLARARREGVRALARRWWRGGEATDLLEDEPDQAQELAALIVEDEVHRVACLPRTSPALDEALELHFAGTDLLPECLRVERLMPRRVPYRSTEWSQRLSVGGERAWAWPFLWLRFRGRDVALVVGPDRVLRAIVAPPR